MARSDGRVLGRAEATSERMLALTQVADRLGVHYMTAYRYVRLGVLPGAKREGMWWVSERAVEGLRSRARPPTRRGGGRWSERLEGCLVAGDGAGAWRLVEGLLAAGHDPTALYVDVLAPALRSLGERWAAGEIDVGEEHKATSVATRIIGSLGPRFRGPGRRRGTVVIGTPPGEQHALPVAMVADVLRAARFDVVELGCYVPVA